MPRKYEYVSKDMTDQQKRKVFVHDNAELYIEIIQMPNTMVVEHQRQFHKLVDLLRSYMESENLKLVKMERL